MCGLHAYAGYMRENMVIISIFSAIRGGGSTGWVVYVIRSQVKQVPSYFTFITQLYVVQAMMEHYCCADKVKGCYLLLCAALYVSDLVYLVRSSILNFQFRF